MSRSPLPQYHEPCGWNALLPPRIPRPAAAGALDADLAVVGAGYTGLAAARRFHELDPRASIVVLEGSTVGESSAGRNSGFANPRDSKIGLSTDQMARAERLNDFATEGFDYLLQAMREGGFDCRLERTGRITAAATELGARKIAAMIDGARAHGFEHRALDRAGVEALTGSGYYRAGILTEEGYLLQPAALIRGLADALDPAIRLHENTPVLSLDRAGGGWRLRTPDAVVSARNVVLAANAGIRHFGHWRDGIVGIHTYAALTEPIEAEETLGAAAWGLLPAHRLGTTLRRVGRDRLLVRSLYAYEDPLDPAAVRAALADRLHRRWPALRGVRLEHVWGGMTALTRNGSPRWGRIDEGLYGSAGCNGSGVVKGTLLGKRLAEMIATGDPQEELQRVYGRANAIAPEPFRRIGFHVVSAIERRKAGLEM